MERNQKVFVAACGDSPPGPLRWFFGWPETISGHVHVGGPGEVTGEWWPQKQINRKFLALFQEHGFHFFTGIPLRNRSGNKIEILNKYPYSFHVYTFGLLTKTRNARRPEERGYETYSCNFPVHHGDYPDGGMRFGRARRSKRSLCVQMGTSNDVRRSAAYGYCS